jgi:hypothetical protein
MKPETEKAIESTMFFLFGIAFLIASFPSEGLDKQTSVITGFMLISVGAILGRLK